MLKITRYAGSDNFLQLHFVWYTVAITHNLYESSYLTVTTKYHQGHLSQVVNFFVK
jgi:hypothetical protein